MRTMAGGDARLGQLVDPREQGAYSGVGITASGRCGSGQHGVVYEGFTKASGAGSP
jgi:hypothetical protein